MLSDTLFEAVQNSGSVYPGQRSETRRMAATGWNNRRKVFAPLGAGVLTANTTATRGLLRHPSHCRQLLLEVETFNRNIWECACGEGHLAKVLLRLGTRSRNGFGEAGLWLRRIRFSAMHHSMAR